MDEMNISKEDKDLSDKIMVGICKAIDKLILASAKNGEPLVVTDENGEVKIVPAEHLPLNLMDNSKDIKN